MRASLLSLKTCWDELQQQVTDKGARLDKAIDFQNRYQVALQHISQWLDEVEQRLFASSSVLGDEDAESRLRDTAALQREIAALQAEISVMNAASQQVMAEAGAGSRHLIRAAVDDLHERLRMLEQQAKEREASLQQRTQRQQSVHDRANHLSGTIAGFHGSVLL